MLSQKWSIGQVDSVVRSKDGVIRRVNVRYHNAGESFPRFTERSVRSLVRLFHVEDSYFVHDLEVTEKMIETLEENDEGNDNAPPPLRLVRLKDGNFKIANTSYNKSCCCCAAHCKIAAHSAVTGNMKDHLLEMNYEMETTYEKHAIHSDDFTMRPVIPVEKCDEIFAQLVALETDFNLD